MLIVQLLPASVAQQLPIACRLKATLERAQRMTHRYTELLLGVFPERVEALGGALGISQERMQVRSMTTFLI